MRRIRMVLFLSTAVLGGIAHAQEPTLETVVKEVSPLELAAMVAENKVVVYDCNEEETFIEAHVPGAILIVYDELTPEKLPEDHATPLVFYCYSPECPAGAMAASSAIALGFTDVHCMTAGIIGWQDAGLKTDP